MKPDSSHTPTVVDDPAVRAAENGAGATARPAKRFCASCGTSLDERTPAITRFGEPFCSEAHAETFVAGVRAARVRAVASAPATDAAHGEDQASTDTQPTGTAPRIWTDRLKKWGCWVAPLGLLLALPLVSSGGTAATAGSVLGFLVLVACPLAMFLMMRSMGNTNQGANMRHGKKDGSEKDD